MRTEYNEKMRSQLFGLLCEYEKDRNWERFLDSILIELLNIDAKKIISENCTRIGKNSYYISIDCYKSIVDKQAI